MEESTYIVKPTWVFHPQIDFSPILKPTGSQISTQMEPGIVVCIFRKHKDRPLFVQDLVSHLFISH